MIILRFSYHHFLQSAIWSAGAKEDYRVATLPSGEPVIASMNLAIDNPELSAENVPAFRLLPDGISAYELWQVQKSKRDLRGEHLDYWNASVELTGTGRPVDAILSPCAPFVAPPHGMNKYIFSPPIISECCSCSRVDFFSNFFFHFIGMRITRWYGMY